MYGERAKKVRALQQRCKEAQLGNKNDWGQEKCGSFVVPDGPAVDSDCGCKELAALAPVALDKLDRYSAWVLSIFNAIQALMSSAMVGALHVPRHELAEEMRARGFDLTEFFLQKFAICEGAFRIAYAKNKDETE